MSSFNYRIFWDNIDLSKNLYSRFCYLSRNFRNILMSDKGNDVYQEANKKLLEAFVNSRSREQRLGSTAKNGFFDTCRSLDRFYTECYLRTKNTGVKWSDDDLIAIGFDEEQYKTLLNSVSQLITYAYNGVHIPDKIKDICQGVKPIDLQEMKANLEELSLADLADNPTNRFPVIFIIDNSISMGENDALSELQKELKNFFAEIKSSDELSSFTELYIATCGGGHNEIVNFAKINRQAEILNAIELKPYGKCMMGTAINNALDMLQRRISQMKDEDIDVQYYCPWMIVLSNGRFRDMEELETACGRIKELKAEKAIQVYPRGITSDADMDSLRTLDEGAVRITSVKGFFKDALYSLSMSCKSSPGNTPVQLIHRKGFGL